MNYDLPTLQFGNTGCDCCSSHGIERREKEQAHNIQGSTDDDAACQAGKRKCKACGEPIGKGKQFCQTCRINKSKERKKWKLTGRPFCSPSSWMNFKRDESGKVIEKLCTGCGQWLPSSAFKSRKDTPSGLVCWCMECDKSRRKSFQEKYQKKNKKDFSILHRGNCVNCGELFFHKGKMTTKMFCSNDCFLSFRRQKQRTNNNSIHVAQNAICKRCGEIKPIHEFQDERTKDGFKILPWVCSACKIESSKISKRKSRNKNKHRKHLSKRFKEAMSIVKRGGSSCFRSVLGCSTLMLRRHLESQFQRGMTWKNYGTKWHVDHILPVSSFDHTDIEQVKRCWHFSNLRPLCAIENRRKSNKIIDCQPELLLQLVDNH